MGINIRRMAAGLLIYAALVSAVSVFIIGPDIPFIAGVLAGCLTSLYKNSFWGVLPVWIASNEKNRRTRAVLIGVGMQFATGVLLFIAVMVNTYLFYGLAAGLLGATVGAVCVMRKR